MLRAKEEHPPRFLAKTQLHLGMKIQAHFSSWKKEWFLIKADYGVYCMCVCVLLGLHHGNASRRAKL